MIPTDPADLSPLSYGAGLALGLGLILGLPAAPPAAPPAKLPSSSPRDARLAAISTAPKQAWVMRGLA